MVHSVRAQRTRAQDTHRSPAIGQRSYAQPPIPTTSAPRSLVSGLPSHGGTSASCLRLRRVLLLKDLLQSCSRGGRRRVEDMCYERRAEACVDESAHHALGPVRNPVL